MKKSIECGELTKSHIIMHENKKWKITFFSVLGSKRLRSFVVVDNDKKIKKEFIFPKTYSFKMDENGVVFV